MKCEVYCCPNKRKKTRGKSFFRFPRDQETVELWLKEIGREGAVINDNRFVCEDHFDASLIFQWKDRKVIDKEATPFHDYRACPICSNPDKDEDEIHPGTKKRKKPHKKRVKSNTADTSDLKSDNLMLEPSEVFIKEEMEDDEQLQSAESQHSAQHKISPIKTPLRPWPYKAHYSENFVKRELVRNTFLTSLEITPLSYMDISAHDTTGDLEVKEEIESAPKTSLDFMDTSLNEYQNVEVLTEAETENKHAEPIPNLHSKIFLEPDILECSANPIESEPINSMERIKGICRICLANYFIGQSIFMIYKMKFLPHIVFNLTGNLPTRDDELPSMICFTCAELLLQAEAARKRCISSDKFLRKQLEQKNNDTKPIEIMKPQKEDLDQNIQPNENNFESAQISTPSNSPNKPSSVSVAMEHNYINSDNRKETKEIRVKKIKSLQIGELLNIIEERLEEEESLNKTEYNPNIEEYSKEKTEYDPNIEEYSKEKTEYDPNIEEYSKEKIEYSQNIEDYSKEKTEYNPSIGEENLNISDDSQNMEEENPLEAQYLDDEVLYDELFSETNVQYKENVELSIDNDGPDPLGMGIILPELFVCTVCSRKITSLRAFKRHQKYHNAENFRCPICPDELTPKTIKDHLYKHQERQELTCGDCNKHFDDIIELYDHIVTHAKAYRRLLYLHECEICHKSTTSLATHLNHMKKKHNIKVHKPFKCDKCGMKFTAKLGLQRHEDNIHNQDRRMNRERKFLCSTCGRRFFTKGTLQVHIRSHTGERPYKCKYCNKSFAQINSVTVHTYIHTGEKPFICNVCGKRFKQYSHYDYHMLIHADKRPHVCNICNRAFRVRGTLNTHMKIHGTRPFRCETCDKGYPERSGLKKHMKKIHGSDLNNMPPKQEEELLEVV